MESLRTSKQNIDCEGVGFIRPTVEFANRSGRMAFRQTSVSEPRTTTFEKRGAMRDRKRLFSTLWLTISLALVVSVLVAPVGTSEFVTISSRPDCLRYDFALPPGQHATCLSAGTATDTVLEVNALPSENEEQDRVDALDEPPVSFLPPSSFHKIPDRQLIAPRSVLPLYPLRC
jgi:hypothetical protein